MEELLEKIRKCHWSRTRTGEDAVQFAVYQRTGDLEDVLKETFAQLLEFFKRAELFGSRGRMRWKNEVISDDRDWDLIVFTDDVELRKSLSETLAMLGEVYIDGEEFWVTTGAGDHLCVLPVAKRKELLAAYAHQDQTGCSKVEMLDCLKEMREKREEVERLREALQIQTDCARAAQDTVCMEPGYLELKARLTHAEKSRDDMQQERFVANQKVIALQEKLGDYEETHRAVMEEKCAGDEVHCTCVPSLRRGLHDLAEERDDLKKLVAQKDEKLRELGPVILAAKKVERAVRELEGKEEGEEGMTCDVCGTDITTKGGYFIPAGPLMVRNLCELCAVKEVKGSKPELPPMEKVGG